MEHLKRYSLAYNEMVEDEKGEWVTWKDVKEIEKGETMAKQDDIPISYQPETSAITSSLPGEDQIDKTELIIEGFDLLPQVAGHLSGYNKQTIREDGELFELVGKSRKYISLMLDKAIEGLGINDNA